MIYNLDLILSSVDINQTYEEKVNETDSEAMNKIQNIVFCQLISSIYSMIEMNIQNKIIKSVSQLLSSQYNLNEDMILNINEVISSIDEDIKS